ncbi:MAG: ATP-binding protein [Bacteroidales bacterium]|jgi:hypothetical protein|nr:ATP-binding protein [Bacteroidales bacterium]
MKNLPIGIQSFEDIRSNYYMYVDKTSHIYRIATTGKIYFLSRPRRFGKSLTISTLEALFTGRKELFEGLYVYDKWDWSRKYPVIRIDWTQIKHRTPEEIEKDLSAVLKLKARDIGIVLTREYVSGCFGELIEQLYRKTGEKVVILIDEYDVPILDVMGKSSEEIKAMQETLHDVYKVMKGADEYIKFIFLTGVSKFAGLSVFSALNNPEDITLSEEYATLCGITQEELESNFPEHLAAVTGKLSMTREELLDNIRKWYNGYSWDGKTSVYNPFSVLQFLKGKSFESFWFRTGTPTFLIELLKKRNNIESFLQPVLTREAVFSSYDPERLETVPLLFQTGYLTIKEITWDDDNSRIYRLEPPNAEVRRAFTDHLFKAYTELPMEEMSRLYDDMRRQIKTCDNTGLERSLRAMIARVPYQLHIEEEKYYHSLLLVWLYFLGFKVQGEIATNIGRIDAVWELPGVTVVAEVKYSADRPLDKLLDEATAQIHDRKYYEPYLADGKQIILISIAFSGKEIGCRMETIA